MKRIEIIVFILILTFGFVVRLYRIDNPIADWHSWRQADTSSVSREFVKNGIDLLHPKYQDLSNIQSGKDNPQGYRFVEFPIFNFFQAVFYKNIGFLTLEEWGRMLSILSSLLSAVFIYLLVKKHIGLLEAIFSAFFFIFLPYSIYFGRVILPDEMMVAAILGGTYFFDMWLTHDVILRPKTEESRRGSFSANWRIRMTIFYMLATIFTASAFLLKPYALFFTLPMVYLAWKKFGFSFIKKWQIWVFLILSITPLIAWRIWMRQYPEGIPVSDWLFNANNIRFKGAFFYWIFGDRLSRLILGYFGVVLLFFGLLKKQNEKTNLFSLSFLVSSLLYLFVIAGGNVQHDYYQILIIPTVVILLAKGSTFLLSNSGYKNKIYSYILLFILSFGMFAFSWYYVRDYFNINNWDMVKAGQETDRILPADAKVIVPYNGDTSFLYQTNRRGWPAFEKGIEELIQMGADYLVLATPTKNDFEGFGRQYKIVSSSPSYLILKLK